jgi:hypothetical protein
MRLLPPTHLPALHQHIAQHNGIVVRLVMRGEDERDRPLAARQRAQPLERVGMFAQLFQIPAAEFLPIRPPPFRYLQASSWSPAQIGGGRSQMRTSLSIQIP